MLLPCRKVVALPDGRLAFNHKVGPIQPIDDGWWQSFSRDWQTPETEPQRPRATNSLARSREARDPVARSTPRGYADWASERSYHVEKWSPDFNGLQLTLACVGSADVAHWAFWYHVKKEPQCAGGRCASKLGSSENTRRATRLRPRTIR